MAVRMEYMLLERKALGMAVDSKCRTSVGISIRMARRSSQPNGRSLLIRTLSLQKVQQKTLLKIVS